MPAWMVFFGAPGVPGLPSAPVTASTKMALATLPTMPSQFLSTLASVGLSTASVTGHSQPVLVPPGGFAKSLSRSAKAPLQDHAHVVFTPEAVQVIVAL